MTEHEHEWGEWEPLWALIFGTMRRTETGYRLRECKVCGRVDVEWKGSP